MLHHQSRAYIYFPTKSFTIGGRSTKDKKWMSSCTEDEIQSVFDHWAHRNQEDVSYTDVKQNVEDKGTSVNSMVAEMDWSYFAPLMMEECFEVDNEASL
jgi:hypothetical protein